MHDDTSHTDQHNGGSPSVASMAGAVVLSLIVVAASCTLSFNALSELAAMSGAVPQQLTALLPVVVDVFILQATWCALLSTRRGDAAGKRYHFAMLAIFASTSVAGNAAHAFLVADRGVTHGLLSVAIAIVAPLALLASIHGLVMHVWTGIQPVREKIPHVRIDAHEQPRESAVDAPVPDARYAQPQVNQADVTTRTDAAVRVNFDELDDQITQDERDLARFMCSRYQMRSDEVAVARALVADRLNAPKNEAALWIGVHRVTIGRWLTLAQECKRELHAHTNSTTALTEAAEHALDERALIGAR